MKGSKLARALIMIMIGLSPGMAYAKQLSCPATNRLTPDEVRTRWLDKKRYPNYFMTCAHRGLWYKYPENSEPALKAAIDLGIDCVENDVRATKDGVLVVYHDKELDARLYDPATGQPAHGTVPETTWAVMSKLRYLDRNSNKTNYPVLTLEQFLAITNDKIVVNHEDKTKDPAIARAMFKMVKEKGRLSQAIVKGRFPYKTYLEIIKGIADESEVTFTPVIFEDTPNYEATFNEYWDAGYRNYELVVQRPNSLLMPLVHQVREYGGRLGQFDVLPESGRGSYWVGKWVDPPAGPKGYDFRSDWEFLINTSKADYIISDRPCLLNQFLAARGLRELDPVHALRPTDELRLPK